MARTKKMTNKLRLEKLEDRVVPSLVARTGVAADVAGITPVRDQFRVDLGGGTNAGANGAFGGLRREINWDGVPDNLSSPNDLPRDFFNTTSPRGVVFTPGPSSLVTGFEVSATAASGNPIKFGNFNTDNPSQFTAFSGERLFTSFGTNVMDVRFFVPGTTIPALVKGFGAIFSDVDSASSTKIEYFNAAGASLGVFTAPSSGIGANSFSFLGVFEDTGAANISRVRITSGESRIGFNDSVTDIVVMDDFLYGEPQSTQFDFGDAPDTYGTTLAANGARHVPIGIFLGTTRDIDVDGQPSPNASGDGSDEDGVTFLDPLIPGQVARVQFTVTNTTNPNFGGFVNVFIDWNRDGDFLDADEIALPNATSFQNQTNIFNINVPANASLGTTFGRFRITGTSLNNTTTTPLGLLPDGEVEDYALTITSNLDFGDAPDTYGTTLAANGARHTATGIFLGTTRDTDADGQPSANASGDGSDEDGVTFLDPLIPGQAARVQFTATNPAGTTGGFVNVFIDWNRDGDFLDAGEVALPNAVVFQGSSNTFNIDVPANASPGATFGRFRITSTSLNGTTTTPLGLLPDGEVEDHALTVIRLGTISGQAFDDVDGDGAKEAGDNGRQGITIQLDKDANGTIDATATSDANGAFNFGNLADGVYRVRIASVNGSLQTSANPADITIAGGNVVAGTDFGLFRTIAASGFVFLDRNGNGVRDAGEGKLGVTVQLDLQADGVTDTTTATAADGSYSFAGVGPGVVRIALPVTQGFAVSSANPVDFTAQSGTDRPGLDFGLRAKDPVAIGAGEGHEPLVIVRDGSVETFNFLAYNGLFRGGVHVATGDVNGDGRPDIITGAGAGGGPHVKVFDGATGAEISSFFAYIPTFAGGVEVSAGDVDGDGFADIITGAGPGGGPHVKVFNGATGAEIRSFFAFDPSFPGGVRVAGGDLDGDGRADLVVSAGPGGGPHVKAFDGVTGAERLSFFAFGSGVTAGVRVAAGDLDGDGRAELIAGAEGLSPHVRVFNGVSGAEQASFFAWTGASAGVRLGVSDVNGDGRAEIVAGSPPGSQLGVRLFDGGGAELSAFAVFEPNFLGGVFVG